VSLKVSNRERLLERLGENQDDLYVLGQPPEGLDVVYEPFLDNPLVVLAPSNHPLAAQRNIPLAQLAEELFIMREPGSGTRIAVERLFRQHGLDVKVRMELGSNEAIKQAIVGGLGISVLSRHTLVLDTATGQITILDVEHFPIKRQWYAAYPTGKQPTIVAQTFLDYLRSASAHI
jgi:DNA-binding transcriptional LysR family regulator